MESASTARVEAILHVIDPQSRAASKPGEQRLPRFFVDEGRLDGGPRHAR